MQIKSFSPLTLGAKIQKWDPIGRDFGDYEEFIGAKKHLVAGVLFHVGRLSNSLAIGAHSG